MCPFIFTLKDDAEHGAAAVRVVKGNTGRETKPNRARLKARFGAKCAHPKVVQPVAVNGRHVGPIGGRHSRHTVCDRLEVCMCALAAIS